VNAALTVHRALGPGLLESAYQECLVIELSFAGLNLEREKVLPLTYRGHSIANAYRLDLIVNGRLLVELKAIASKSLLTSSCSNCHSACSSISTFRSSKMELHEY
jgi:GxxExxY protein